MPLATVNWRAWGHLLTPSTDVLRFEVGDLNRVITRSVADSDRYQAIQNRQGHPTDWQVLVLSCFAVTATWTPQRLAAGTGFRQYRLAPAGRLLTAGVELWPTEVLVDGVGEPSNEVHYDLVVAAGPALFSIEALASPDKATRSAGRDQLRPRFEWVLGLLGEPLALDAPPTENRRIMEGGEDHG